MLIRFWIPLQIGLASMVRAERWSDLMGKLKFVGFVIAALFSLPVCEAAQYAIRDLGTPGRTTIEVSINDLGQVITSIAPEELLGFPTLLGEAFLVDGSNVSSLGSLGGSRVVASAINNYGIVVGQAELTTGATDGFIFHSGQLDSFNLEAIGATGGTATSINDRGDIVGQAVYGNVSRAFLQSSMGVFKPLNTLGGNHAHAFDVNENSTVVGASRTASDDFFVAFMFDDDAIVNIGTLGGPSSSANAINDNAVIVGSSSTADGVQHAALFINGSSPIDLAPMWAQSGAADINNLGQIVGFVTDNPDQQLRAALFNTSGPPILLQDLIPNDSGWTTLYAASGINERGQIVGAGIFNNQPGIRAFLMTPIPEPSTFVLLVLVSSIAIVRFRRR
jgi:probable HAF family extracellular repeat protein